MNDDNDLKQLLVEIRDNQRLSLKKQDEHLEIARLQIERAKTQIAESIELQKLAIGRAKAVARIAIPGILICLGLIVYLIIVYL